MVNFNGLTFGRRGRRMAASLARSAAITTIQRQTARRWRSACGLFHARPLRILDFGAGREQDRLCSGAV